MFVLGWMLMLPLMDNNIDGHNVDDILDDKFDHGELLEITIANMSEENKIAVLIENKKNLQDREELLQLLTNDKSETRAEIFIKNGFIVIDIEGGSQEFYKIWDMFVLLYLLLIVKKMMI